MAQMRKIRLSPWLISLLSTGILLNEGTMLTLGLLCVLLHEGGHILTAKRFGVTVDRVTLSPFGGRAELSGLSDLSPWEEVEVALGGPLVSILLAAVFGCLAHIFPQFADSLDSLMILNCSLSVFNLLPVFPLDGSRILARLTEGRPGEKRAARLSAFFGIVLGVAFCAFGLLFGLAVGRVNVTWLLCGAYLIYENIRRKKAQPFTQMRKTAQREGLLARKGVVKVQSFAARQGMSDGEILRRLPGGVLCHVTYLDENGREVSAQWL